MLNRDNRTLFSESLSLPEGSEIEKVYGGTFTCSLELIMAILLWLDGSNSNPECIDPIEVLKSMFENARKTTIWYSRGYASLDQKPSKLIELLNEVLVEAPVPERSIFHPKFILIKYILEDSRHNSREVRYRLIVMSRNFSFSSSWDTIFCIEGCPASEKTSFGTNLSLFLSSIDNERNYITDNELNEIQTVNFSLKGDLEEVFDLGCEFHWQNPNSLSKAGTQSNSKYENTIAASVKGGIRNTLIISPFLNQEFLYYIAKRTDGTVTVISSQSMIDGLDIYEHEKDKGKFKFWVIEGPKENESGNIYKEEIEPEHESDPSEPSEHSFSLHAKILMFEQEDKNTLYTGSGNATSGGWLGGSTEAMVSLSSSSYNIKDFWQQTFELKDGRPVPWLREYYPEKWEEDSEEKEIDTLHSVLADIEIRMRIDGDRSVYELSIVNIDDIINKIKDYKYDIFIESLNAQYMKENKVPFKSFLEGAQKFSYNDDSILSVFVYVHIYKSKELKCSFLVMANVEWGNINSTQRLQNIFRSIISSPARFFSLLRLILTGMYEPIEDSDATPKQSDKKGKESNKNTPDSFDPGFTIEELLWSLARDRKKANKIDSFVTLYRDSGGEINDELSAFFGVWEIMKQGIMDN